MIRIPPVLRGVVVAAGACSLASCSSMGDKENAGPCPNAFALSDASRVVEFAQPDEENFGNVAYTAEIQAVHTLCRYVEDKPIDSELELEIGFGRGPAATERQHTYNVWVAVTRTDVVVLDRVSAPMRVSFPRGEDRVYLRRKIDHIRIPRADEETSGSNFEILVGFDVTPEQLAFNRQGKRFTMDAVQ